MSKKERQAGRVKYRRAYRRRWRRDRRQKDREAARRKAAGLPFRSVVDCGSHAFAWARNHGLPPAEFDQDYGRGGLDI